MKFAHINKTFCFRFLRFLNLKLTVYNLLLLLTNVQHHYNDTNAFQVFSLLQDHF